MNYQIKLGMGCIFIAIVNFSASHALAMDYFDAPIDFWKDQRAASTTALSPLPVLKSGQDSKKSEFDWKTYLDPKHDEFFREGDYSPPKPFMEVARNPSNENLKNWFDYMRIKNEIATRLQNRMQEYAGVAVQQAESVPVKKPNPQQIGSNIDPKRFRFRMYFDSHCPHCKRMFETLERLRLDGFDVEALQVDSSPLLKRSGSIPIERAAPGDVQKHKIESIPHVIIADLKREALLPAIKGYQSYENVIQLLREVN